MSVDAASALCCCGEAQQWGPCCYCGAQLSGVSVVATWTGSVSVDGGASCNCLKLIEPNWQYLACQTVNIPILNVWSQSGSISSASQILAFQSSPINNCQFASGSTKIPLLARRIQINCDGTCEDAGGAEGGLEVRIQAYAPRGICGSLPIRNFWSVAVIIGYRWQSAFGGSTTNFTSIRTLWYRLAGGVYTNCPPPPFLEYAPNGQFGTTPPPQLSETCAMFGNVAASYVIDPGTIVFS